jgi:hypothetical protein
MPKAAASQRRACQCAWKAGWQKRGIVPWRILPEFRVSFQTAVSEILTDVARLDRQGLQIVFGFHESVMARLEMGSGI